MFSSLKSNVLTPSGPPKPAAVAAVAPTEALGQTALYAIVYDYDDAGRGALYHIDPATETVTEIGGLGSAIHYVSGIAFDADGTLYGWGFPTNDCCGIAGLVTINLTSGKATIAAKRQADFELAFGDITFKPGVKRFGMLANSAQDEDLDQGVFKIRRNAKIAPLPNMRAPAGDEGNAIAANAKGQVFVLDDVELAMVQADGKLRKHRTLDFGAISGPDDSRVNSATFDTDGTLWGIVNTIDESLPGVGGQYLVTIDKKGNVTTKFKLPKKLHFDALAAPR